MNKTGKRADKTKVVKIKNAKNADGVPIMHGETRLRKEIERYTITCDMENCDGIGRYDEIGEIVCEDCGRVISQKPNEKTRKVLDVGEAVDKDDDTSGPTPKPSGRDLLRPTIPGAEQII